jgi:hypothetical protein
MRNLRAQNTSTSYKNQIENSQVLQNILSTLTSLYCRLNDVGDPLCTFRSARPIARKTCCSGPKVVNWLVCHVLWAAQH